MLVVCCGDNISGCKLLVVCWLCVCVIVKLIKIANLVASVTTIWECLSCIPDLYLKFELSSWMSFTKDTECIL